MSKIKKGIIGLGSIAATSLPIAGVIACGTSDDDPESLRQLKTRLEKNISNRIPKKDVIHHSLKQFLRVQTAEKNLERKIESATTKAEANSFVKNSVEFRNFNTAINLYQHSTPDIPIGTISALDQAKNKAIAAIATAPANEPTKYDTSLYGAIATAKTALEVKINSATSTAEVTKFSTAGSAEFDDYAKAIADYKASTAPLSALAQAKNKAIAAIATAPANEPTKYDTSLYGAIATTKTALEVKINSATSTAEVTKFSTAGSAEFDDYAKAIADYKASTAPYVAPTAAAFRRILTHFTVTKENTNPYIAGYVAASATKEFSVYDNTIFKIYIQNDLIGPNKAFKNAAAALKLATKIAENINIGPGISHLTKGIQIVASTASASLGGMEGAQVAIPVTEHTLSSAGIDSVASVATHEYGHHETMWDMTNILGISLGDDANQVAKSQLVAALTDAGFTKLATAVNSIVYTGPVNPIGANPGTLSASLLHNLPSAYGLTTSSTGMSPTAKNYVMGHKEIATRLWNILSFKSSSPSDIFAGKHEGSVVPGAPAYMQSYVALAHYAKETPFGSGKDSSKIAALYNALLEKVNGRGTGIVALGMDPTGTKVGNFKLFTFGKDHISDLVVKDSKGVVVKRIKVTTKHGIFGHKNELISNTGTDEVIDYVDQTFDLSSLNIPLNTPGAGYTIEAYNGKTQVDISKFTKHYLFSTQPYNMSAAASHMYVKNKGWELKH